MQGQMAKIARDRLKKVLQRRRIGVFTHVNPVAQQVAPYGHQATTGQVQIDPVARVGDGGEGSGRVIRPAVIAATEVTAGLACLLLHHRGTPVAAGIIEGPNLAVGTADHQDRSAGPAPDDEAAGLG